MHFPTALLLSVISISISSVAAAPFFVEPAAIANLAERDLDAFQPEVELERRNFMDASEALEERDFDEEEIVLAMRSLDDLHEHLMERDANGEDLSELERRFNWHKLGQAAKVGLRIANKLVAREEAPEVELLERDTNDELSELERRFNWKKLGKFAKVGLKLASNVAFKRDEMPEGELFERDFIEEEDLE